MPFHHTTSRRETPNKPEEAVLCFFVDLAKAFDWVLREVVRWV